MSTLQAGLPGRHPAVVSRRLRELVGLALATLIPLALALAISTQTQRLSVGLVLAAAAGGVCICALVMNSRLEVTVTIVVLYLGLLEGPVKLGIGGHEIGSVVRDVLIFAVCLGAILRMIANQDRVLLPALSGWVLAWVALVLVEAFNPRTQGIAHTLGGFREQLEWVPFFFFGYVLLRSKERFRKYFLLLGVIALANGVVSTYQTKLTPAQLASWGPGYRELVYGTSTGVGKGGLKGRVFSSEGEARVRPPGLGTDAGFSGGVGVVALPATLALLAFGRARRRWWIIMLSFGAIIGIVTGLGRLQVIGAVFAILAFTALSFSAGRRVTRPMAAMLAVVALAIPVGAVFVSLVGGNTFNRYASITPEKLSSGNTKDTKQSELKVIPKTISQAPFGIGLGSVGAAASLGGARNKEGEGLEKVSASAETQYNFVTDELGLPGLILWTTLTISVIAMVLRGISFVPDVELRVYLAALFATFIAMALMGFAGPTMASASWGPFFWSTIGVAAYWFAGPGRAARAAAAQREGSAVTGALA